MKVVSTSVEGVDFSKYKTIEFLGWSEGSEKLVNQLELPQVLQEYT